MKNVQNDDDRWKGFLPLDLQKAEVQRRLSRRSDSWRVKLSGETILECMDVQPAFDNGTLSNTVRDMDTNATLTAAFLTERV